MDAGFQDQRGKLTWTLPPEAEQLLSQATPEQRAQVLDLFNKSLGILCFFMLRSFSNQRLAQHLEGIMNIMTDLVMAAAQQQQQQE
jgi:hypothetical protein